MMGETEARGKYLILSVCFHPSEVCAGATFVAAVGMTERQRLRPSLPAAQQAMRMKIISFGSEGVGKSCLIKRFCEDKYVSKYISTIGVDFGVKPVKVSGQSVRVNFFDCAGGAEYFEIRNEFYKDASGGLLVFDVSNRESFEALGDWLTEANSHGANDPVLVVSANKADCDRRAVSEAEGRQWAASRGLAYFETSAKDGNNVTLMFEALFAAVLAAVEQKAGKALLAASRRGGS